MMQLSMGPKETPPVASTRAYLRNGLPSLYQDGDFGMRFIGSLEELLDPIVAILDALPSHFDPELRAAGHPEAARGVARGGPRRDTGHQDQREMVRRAAELGRRRGTVQGLELALKLHFPYLPLRVEDNGGVIWHGKAGQGRECDADFVVYCDKPVDADLQASVARIIEQYKPVQATYRLRVKAAKKKVES